MSILKTAFGGGRAFHAAAIAVAAASWGGYETLHANKFAEHNLQKMVVVNAAGEIIERADEKSALVHHANGTTRHEDFLVIRDMIIEVRRRDLNGINDLKAAGLTFNADIGSQLIGFEVINEFQDAKQEMNPNSFQANDTVFSEDYVPNPITHSTFGVNWRQEGFNYKRSMGLSESLRQTSERLEETLFNGNPSVIVNFNGNPSSIYGYTTDPKRGTGTISDWSLAVNQNLIVNEVIAEVGQMFTNQGGVRINSVILYVSNDFWNILQKDYVSDQPSKTILERLKDIAEIKDVKPAEPLAAKSAVLVEMTNRTVECAVASDIIVVPHTKTNPMEPQVLTTYAAMVHKIKADSQGNTGVRHLTI